VLRLVREGNADRLGAGSLPRDLGLTQRQIAVLRGLVEGLSYREIGERMDISLDTVRSHIRQIYAALQVHSVAEAVSYALRHGLA
jgi:DNA-binding NarL/FixJ family response regulator